jgi:hypothetical protein
MRASLARTPITVSLELRPPSQVEEFVPATLKNPKCATIAFAILPAFYRCCPNEVRSYATLFGPKVLADINGALNGYGA